MLFVLWNCEDLQSPAQPLHCSTTHAAAWDMNLRLRVGPTWVGRMWGGSSHHRPAQGRVSTTVTPATNRSGADPRTRWGTLHTLQNTHIHCKEDLHDFTYKSHTETGINKVMWFLHRNSAKYFSTRVKKPSWLWNASPSAFPCRYYNHKSSSLEINKREDDDKSMSNV